MKTSSTFCLLFVFCLGALNTIKAQVNVQDSLALVDLYNSTNGPEWTYHNNWLIGDVANWHGITVGKERVISVQLTNNNLKGKIPSSFGNLSNLETLQLESNQLNGPIPPDLGNLSRLVFLDLRSNQLSGNIPSELGNLSILLGLYLNNNQLSGTIPSELGNLSNLGFLILNNNQLSGPIPPELGNISRLDNLDLNSNQLSGTIPPELSNVTYLSSLNLNGNQLSGPIPPELGNLLYLHYLSLGSNQLSGNIPPELGKLSLFDLSLSHNQLSGPIPPELGNISIGITSGLDLSHNQLSGPIPPEIGFNLYSLDLSHNKFTFDGMELVATKFPFAEYDWQMPIPLHKSDNTLSVSAGGTLSNNTYVWYKRDKPGNITISGDSVFHPTESGTYFVKVRNKIAKDLRLVSRAIKYTVPSSTDAIALNKEQDFLDNSFSVYPNPARNVLHVKANENTSFSLIRADGKILLTSNIDKTGAINIRDLAAGVYYLRNNNTNASKKVSVTK